MKLNPYIVLLIILLLLTACGRHDNSIIDSTGTIEATQVDIRCEVGGEILKLHVDEGDRVAPGDLLAEIDHEKLDYELDSARAGLRELQARLALHESGFRDEEVRKAAEALKEAEVLMQDARREYKRIEALYDEGVVSIHERDKAEAAYSASLKRCEQAELNSTMYADGFRTEEVSAARAARDRAAAQVRLLERTVADATVTNPTPGIVSERYAEPGEIVSAGSLLYTITDLHDCWIMAYVSEKYLGRIQYGQSAYVVVDSYPERKFSGKVVYISTDAEFTPKNIQTKEERVKLVYGVKVEINNNEELLKPGMPADVVINVQ